MEVRKAEVDRRTKETYIKIFLNLESNRTPEINTSLPFFDHILYSMAFHGEFYLNIQAKGDIQVDPHHLVEDTGLVLGDALKVAASNSSPIKRFGHFIIPMDDALSEVTIDAGGRPYLVYKADYPQPRAGNFDIFLLKDFLKSFSDRAGITLHAECRYGENSHHMTEALFKALGKAIKLAYTPASKILSTKGTL